MWGSNAFVSLSPLPSRIPFALLISNAHFALPPYFFNFFGSQRSFFFFEYAPQFLHLNLASSFGVLSFSSFRHMAIIRPPSSGFDPRISISDTERKWILSRLSVRVSKKYGAFFGAPALAANLRASPFANAPGLSKVE